MILNHNGFPVNIENLFIFFEESLTIDRGKDKIILFQYDLYEI